ncbi:EamA family transporter [Rariglobus hedericola]|uniref:EamA family transporter n=1 Tax=Rariglobus hedericola TaxID=2597822 RepID=A0A556QNN3_9BACT|nr:EamA family transporter [Rariglobus hedericola]TSJ78212.1 EamA family transporter [Rariglobus hedericola]
MVLLLLVSLLWAFSPGLIKHFLGDLPSPAVATVRLGLTFLIFAPLLNPRGIARSTAAWLAGIGAIQFGMMYLLYLQAFQFLQGHEVYLFTIFTPIYVVLLDAALTKQIGVRHMLAAVLSVAGAGVVIQRSAGTANVMIGFLLVQGANLCFAAGQIAYKKTRPALAHITDQVLFAWLALGGFITTALVAIPSLGFSFARFSPTPLQWLVLAFLGLIASGAGFFVWNRGLTQVNAGTLAALNNAKIPLGVLVSLLVFHEPAHLERLLTGLALLIVAVLLAEWKPRSAATKKADR